MQQIDSSVVKFKDVTINKKDQIIFENLNFTIDRKDFIFILGCSDQERTLILYNILGLLKPSKGNISIFGNDISYFNEIKILNIRKKIGYVHPQKGLIKNLSLKENILLPLRFNSILNESDILKRYNKIIDILGLQDIIENNIWEIDNLMEKKLLFARAIINNPMLLLIDEPSTYIEKSSINDIHNLIEIIINNNLLPDYTTIIITSEDYSLAKIFSKKILYLENNKLNYFGESKEFFKNKEV